MNKSYIKLRQSSDDVMPGKATRTLLVSSTTVALIMTTLTANAKFDIPTGAPLSPLFGAQPFQQQMLRFEEFGPQPIPNNPPAALLPVPNNCMSSPAGAALDSFLATPLFPAPTVLSNVQNTNPWLSKIQECVSTNITTSPIEGRPPGIQFSHQRADEFPPVEYIQSAQAGARVNGGFRNPLQLHGYTAGEFGPGGLYHNTTGTAGFNGTTAGIQVRFHPNMPVQDPTALWTFDGTFPPKLLTAQYGKPVMFRHYNALMLDEAANFGFGLHTITTHEHNGHNPAESDGYANAFFFPGQFYDYRWPMVVAGHDSINTNASDPRSAGPLGNKVPGDWHEIMSTHWFHDHMLDFTAQNVYKGNAAMMNYYSSIDPGREDPTGSTCHYSNPSNVNLCLPSGSAVPFGNRDYDVNLSIADKAWDQNGQLFFNIFNVDGFMGDRVTVNWLYKPYLEVRPRRYRFRILNASVSRYFKIALVDETGNRIPFHMIANDGNLMEHTVPFPNNQSQDLPAQGIAERYDIIVDFSNYKGGKIYMVNTLEHRDGRRPKDNIPLNEILSGEYEPNGEDGDPGVGKFLEFRVTNDENFPDPSMNPADYQVGGKKMIPLPGFTEQELAGALHRTFEFGRSSGTDEKPWTIKTNGGNGLGMDPHRISAAPVRSNNGIEIWHIENGGGGWSHPIHIHFEEGQVLTRDGEKPPIWEQFARKDVYRIGNEVDSSDKVTIAYRFREFLGTYMEHCHNTQHEDHAMLLRWDIDNPGQTVALQTPIPNWNGVTYDPSFLLPTVNTGQLDQNDQDGEDDFNDNFSVNTVNVAATATPLDPSTNPHDISGETDPLLNEGSQVPDTPTPPLMPEITVASAHCTEGGGQAVYSITGTVIPGAGTIRVRADGQNTNIAGNRPTVDAGDGTGAFDWNRQASGSCEPLVDIRFRTSDGVNHFANDTVVEILAASTSLGVTITSAQCTESGGQAVYSILGTVVPGAGTIRVRAAGQNTNIAGNKATVDFGDGTGIFDWNRQLTGSCEPVVDIRFRTSDLVNYFANNTNVVIN